MTSSNLLGPDVGRCLGQRGSRGGRARPPVPQLRQAPPPSGRPADRRPAVRRPRVPRPGRPPDLLRPARGRRATSPPDCCAGAGYGTEIGSCSSGPTRSNGSSGSGPSWRLTRSWSWATPGGAQAELAHALRNGGPRPRPGRRAPGPVAAGRPGPPGLRRISPRRCRRGGPCRAVERAAAERRRSGRRAVHLGHDRAAEGRRAVATGASWPRCRASRCVTRRLPRPGAEPPPPSRSLLSIPLFHVGGLQQIITPMVGGGTLVFTEGRFDPGRVVAPARPGADRGLVDRPDHGEPRDGLDAGDRAPRPARRPHGRPGRLARGHATAPEGAALVPQRLGRVAVTYGLSEGGGVLVTAAGRELLDRPGAVGKPLKVVALRIDDPDEAGCGEILVRSPSVMLGYWPDPEQPDDAADHRGPLAAHRRHRPDRRGRLPVRHRPQQGHRDPRRGEHRHPERREPPDGTPGGPRGRGDRPAPRAPRRRGRGRGRAGRGRPGRPG